MSNREFAALTEPEQAAVRRVVNLAHTEDGRQSETLSDGSEAYAYQGHQGISWGFNDVKLHGFCIARGVWPEGAPV